MPVAMADWWASLPEKGAGLLLIQFQVSPPAVPRTAPVGVESSTQDIRPAPEGAELVVTGGGLFVVTGGGVFVVTGEVLVSVIGSGLMLWPLAITKTPSPGLK